MNKPPNIPDPEVLRVLARNKNSFPPKYKIGDAVSFLDNKGMITKAPYWNGLTWMYTFPGLGTFGEEYLILDKAILHIGTITWFECSKVLPPLDEDDELQGYTSKCVLVTNGSAIAMNTLKYGAAEDFKSPRYWLNPNVEWQPTHWAYINYPEPS